MDLYILKSKTAKFGIGAVVVVIFIVGVLWINGKQKHTEPETRETIVMKIPKSEIPSPDSSVSIEEKPDIQSELPPDEAEQGINPPVAVSEAEGKLKEGGISVEPESAINEMGENRSLEKDGKGIQLETAGYHEEDLPGAGQEQIVVEKAAPAIEPENDVPKQQQTDSEIKNRIQPEANQKKEDSAVPKPAFSDTGHPELILQDIRLSENMKGKILEIRTNNSIPKHRYFVLSSPPRLVIDLPGKWKKPSFQYKTVSSDLVSKIRLWRHERKLRIVCDLLS
ncbi:MAG: AMIN domain-containing protein, partial [Deltaproteobacteria bacterium]